MSRLGRLSRRRFLAHSTLAGAAIGLGTVPAFGQAAPRPSASLPPFAPAPADPDAAVFAAARKRFLFPETVTYCNTGTLGASPRDVVDAMNGGVERLEHSLPDWPYFQADGEPLTGYQQLLDARSQLGAFIGATPEEVAITLNATMGMNFLANGLDLAAGDEVLTTDQEHSGGIGGWRLRAKRHGVIVRELPLLPCLDNGPEAIVRLFADAMSPRTKVVMFSHITSGLGIVLPAKDLSQLAHEHGALAIVDGAQVIGQRRLNVKEIGCDAYVTSPHKWLLAPKGTGVLYIRRDVQPRFWVTLASSHIEDDGTGAFRFMQYGTGSVPVVEGLMAALGFIERIGIDRIERWDLMLANRLRDGLVQMKHVKVASPADRRLASAIATFAVPGVTGRELQDALWARKIRVRAQGQTVDRPVRLSAHIYVNPADIDRVLDAVAGVRS
ncbi:MAG: aminotransferase class V-fold PLP-dependent enzyme [Bacteroidales bacterium]